MLLKGSKGFLHSSSHLCRNYSIGISNQTSKGIAAADVKIPHNRTIMIQDTEVRSEHIITCRGSLEWKQSLQVAEKQSMQLQLAPGRKGSTCKVISVISHLQLFRRSLGGTGRTVANICVFCLRNAYTGKCVLGCSNPPPKKKANCSYFLDCFEAF